MLRHVVVSLDGLEPRESPPGFAEGEGYVEVRACFSVSPVAGQQGTMGNGEEGCCRERCEMGCKWV